MFRARKPWRRRITRNFRNDVYQGVRMALYRVLVMLTLSLHVEQNNATGVALLEKANEWGSGV